MADRGRKANPVSSHLIDDWWQNHCMTLHKERLKQVKGKIDQEEPDSTKHYPNPAKRRQRLAERQEDIDHANQILLDKLIRIKSTDSTKVFRPWLARSTFQYGPGIYIDPTTGTKCIDHLNFTANLSPRSIHSPLNRPGSSHTTLKEREAYMVIVDQNNKLLRTIQATDSVYKVEELNKEAMRHAEHSRRLSNFRGPQSARYVPCGVTLRQQQDAMLRPYSAQPGGIEPKTKVYTPMQRRSVSAPRRGPAWGSESEPSWGGDRYQTKRVAQPQAAGGMTSTRSAPVNQAPTSAAAAKLHRAELEELGVVEEGDDGQEDTLDYTSLAAAGSPAVITSSRNSSANRPTSGRPMSAAMRTSDATAKPPPALATVVSVPHPPDSPRSQASSSMGSRAGSARSSKAGTAVSPYLQPVSAQQSARMSSRPSSSQSSRRPSITTTSVSATVPVQSSGASKSSPTEEDTVKESSWASSAHDHSKAVTENVAQASEPASETATKEASEEQSDAGKSAAPSEPAESASAASEQATVAAVEDHSSPQEASAAESAAAEDSAAVSQGSGSASQADQEADAASSEQASSEHDEAAAEPKASGGQADEASAGGSAQEEEADQEASSEPAAGSEASQGSGSAAPEAASDDQGEAAQEEAPAEQEESEHTAEEPAASASEPEAEEEEEEEEEDAASGEVEAEGAQHEEEEEEAAAEDGDGDDEFGDMPTELPPSMPDSPHDSTDA